jgi:hypothetical protein
MEGQAAIRFVNREQPIVYVKGRDLVPHPMNWRTHPQEQIAALSGIMTEVGVCDAVKGFRLPDGRIQLIDGHARAELLPDQEIPVLLLDVTEQEAKKLLTVFDPLGDLAGIDAERLSSLLGELDTQSPGLKSLAEELASLIPEREVTDLDEKDATEKDSKLADFIAAREKSRAAGKDRMDTHFWVCLVFQNHDQKKQFLEQIPEVPNVYGSYVDGYALAKAIGKPVEPTEQGLVKTIVEEKLEKLAMSRK